MQDVKGRKFSIALARNQEGNEEEKKEQPHRKPGGATEGTRFEKTG